MCFVSDYALRTVLPKKLEEFGLEDVAVCVGIHHVVKLVVSRDDRRPLREESEPDETQ